MRRSYVQIDGVLYEKGNEPLPEGVMVMGDIQPYVSQIDGSLINSRSQHREHLRANGCQEIGNEVGAQMKHYERAREQVTNSQRASARELIRAQIDAMPHREFRAAIKRDADRVKWNSNS